MNLLIFLLLAYGITNIMVYGSIPVLTWWRILWMNLSPRWIGKLFTCPMCLSTWVGFGLSYLFITLGIYTPMSGLGVEIIPLAVFLDGCLTSGGVWIMHTVQEFFEKNEE